MDSSICITGFPGSGKSTVCQNLTGDYDLDIVSAGSIMREIAISKGISVNQVNELAAEDGSNIDDMIDKRTLEISRTGSYIFDSRMAWHYVENCRSIFLSATVETAAERAFTRPDTDEEQYANFDSAKRSIKERRESEVARYKSLYGVTLDAVKNFDIFIFTDRLSALQVYTIVRSQIQNYSGNRAAFSSPSFLIPTQNIRDLDEKYIKGIDCQYLDPIQVIRHNDRLFIWDGHNKAAAALLRGVSHVEVEVIDIPIKNLSVEKFVSSSVSISQIHDWEAALGTSLRYDHESLILPT